MTTELATVPVQVVGPSRYDELRRVVLDGVSAENSKRNYALALGRIVVFLR